MPTGIEIAEKARIPLNEHWGYIFATSGQVWTQAAQDKIEKTKTDDPNYKYSIQYGSKWIGRKVADCSGLVVWVHNHFGIRLPHGSNNMYKNGYLKEKGVCNDSIPVGALVFKLREPSDYHHVGIYIGNNTVVEAQGSKAGVVKSTLSGWTHYGLVNGIDYDNVSSKQRSVNPLGAGVAIVDVPNDGTLNVRNKPSTSGNKITTVREGESLEVLAVAGDWAKVRYSGEGYVMTKYLKVVSEG